MNLTWFMANFKSNPKLILRQAQDDGLNILKIKIMVSLRPELRPRAQSNACRTMILEFDIDLAFGF